MVRIVLRSLCLKSYYIISLTPSSHDSEALVFGSNSSKNPVRRVHDITNSNCTTHQIREMPTLQRNESNILFTCSPIANAVLLTTNVGAINYVECNPEASNWSAKRILHKGSLQGRYKCIKFSDSGRRAVTVNTAGEVRILDFSFSNT